MLYDFRAEFCIMEEEKPIEKTPVLVYSRRFAYGFNVCRYNGVGFWLIDGTPDPLRVKAADDDQWAYLPYTD